MTLKKDYSTPLKKDRGSKLLFSPNKDRIEKLLREIRKEATESKKQTPGQTAYTLKAGSRLRSRLQGARQEIAKYSKDMPAGTKARYMENVKKLSRMLEGQPTSPNTKTTYKSDFTPRSLAGQTYKAGATKLGRKETTGDRYTRVQSNLLDKKKDKMAGKDPGESKFNKGGMVKKYNMGGKVPTYAGMPMMADGGVVPKKKKKKVSKKKSIDGVARQGRTKGRMV